MNNFFTLVKFEFKKIISKKLTIIAIAAFIFICFTYGQNGGIWYTENPDGTVGRITGQEAVDLSKEAFENQSDYLDEAQIGEAITHINQVSEELGVSEENGVTVFISDVGEDSEDAVMTINPESMTDTTSVHRARTQQYNVISGLIASAGYDTAISGLTEEDAKDFYTNRTNQINSSLDNGNYVVSKYSQEQKDIFKQRNDEISTPFEYGYMQGWDNLISTIGMISMFFAVIAIILLSSVFSSEYTLHTDQILLTTKNGVAKTAFAKIFTSLSLITILFIVGFGVNFLSVTMTHGIDGWNLPIQLSFFTSIYNFTMLEAYLVGLGISFSVVMAISCSALFYSAFAKTPFIAVIINSLIFIAPLVFQFIPRLIMLFPMMSVFFDTHITSYNSYNIFGTYVDQFIVILVISLITMLICIPLTFIAYKRRKNG